ncbi:MAG: ABC-type transport system involved in multi-copper enzyme maturation, permease component, partial [Bacteroidetes bacterium]|nr:ABC-type transport system involved in multi-copper enzyme maturation, permease component [Bacteroidota bacterium]
FTLAWGIILMGNGPEGVVPYALFVLLSLALSLVFLGIAVLVATVNRRKSRAFGVSLFLWFFFVLFYDLIALGGTLFFRGSSANVFLFVSLFGNPVDMVRVATLILLDNITIFGAAGAVMLRFLGGQISSVALLVVGLAVWAALPVIVANRLMRRQDL